MCPFSQGFWWSRSPSQASYHLASGWEGNTGLPPSLGSSPETVERGGKVHSARLLAAFSLDFFLTSLSAGLSQPCYGHPSLSAGTCRAPFWNPTINPRSINVNLLLPSSDLAFHPTLCHQILCFYQGLLHPSGYSMSLLASSQTLLLRRGFHGQLSSWASSLTLSVSLLYSYRVTAEILSESLFIFTLFPNLISNIAQRI